MPEPTTVTVSAVAGAMSAVTLALLGVDYQSLLYALVGALFALPHVDAMGRWRAVMFVVLSTLAGAVMGAAVQAYYQTQNRPVLFLACIIAGLTVQVGAAALLKNVPRLIDGAVKRFTGGK